MPLFFFHYRTSDGCERDDTGCEFPSLELAYLDAFRGAIDITAEMLHAGENPFDHRIDITDAGGTVLLDLPFEEVLRRRPTPRPKPDPIQRADDAPAADLKHLIARGQMLRSEITLVCIGANAAIMAARALIARSKATASGGADLMDC